MRFYKSFFLFLLSHSWFCHFDDDNYVNVAALSRLLSSKDPSREWYLGKTSVSEPLQVMDHRKTSNKNKKKNPRRVVSFWFATGGAGVCLSRATVERAQREGLLVRENIN